ncbi:hypothetical protein, partial [Paraclostridium dentum]|uniref:hypothetical protein n=1 Tax=Paraclostridium dentum TaxID=2662455 RepID=UPI0014732325
MFLEGVVVDRFNYLQFSSNDPNTRSTGHQIIPMNDGNVRIKSDHFDRFWRRSPNWIWADSSDTTARNRDTLFRPVKVDANTIGLINLGNNMFCKRLTADNKVSCLNAADQSLSIFARLLVQEQVLERTISNV